jgi:hypothetical protein
MAKKKQQEDYEQKLRDSFDHWQHLYEYGGQDPSWADGVNLNLVRNHIYYYKRQIEETMEPGSYPEIYYRARPPEVPNDYMARAGEIREKAQVSLSLYRADKEYRFLARRVDLLDPKDEKRLCVRNVLNYAAGLEMAIQEDDLVTMRRHLNPDSYLSSFKSCAEKVRDLKPPENEQLSLFHFYDGYDGQDMDEEELEM